MRTAEDLLENAVVLLQKWLAGEYEGEIDVARLSEDTRRLIGAYRKWREKRKE